MAPPTAIRRPSFERKIASRRVGRARQESEARRRASGLPPLELSTAAANARAYDGMGITRTMSLSSLSLAPTCGRRRRPSWAPRVAAVGVEGFLLGGAPRDGAGRQQRRLGGSVAVEGVGGGSTRSPKRCTRRRCSGCRRRRR